VQEAVLLLCVAAGSSFAEQCVAAGSSVLLQGAVCIVVSI